MKTHARLRLVLLFLTLSCGSWACVPHRVPPSVPETAVAPWGADRWQQEVLTRLDHWKRFQAAYQAKFTDSLERVWRARLLVTGSLPDRMRIEILNSWGQTQGLFLLRDAAATLWVVPEKAVYTSYRSATLLERLIGIGLSGNELAPALLGLPPQDVLVGSVARRLRDGTVVFGSSEPEREFSRRYGLCPDGVRLCRMELNASGTSVSVSFQYRSPQDDRDVPSSLLFQSTTGSVELTRTHLVRPADIPPETFDLPALGDAVRIVETP